MTTVRTDQRDGGVRVLTLDRPPANAEDETLLADLGRALDEARADDAVRAIVVTGAGRFFSAGFDLAAPRRARGGEACGEGGIGRDVDRGPRERDGPVTDRPIRGRRDAVGGELGLVVHRGQRFDPDQRMDARNRMRDVPHVGRPGGAFEHGAEVRKRAPERLGVPPVERRQRAVVRDLGIRRAAGANLHAGAGRERAGLEAAEHLGADLVELAERLGAHDVARRGMGGDDVRRVAAVRDDAVDAIAPPDVLAEEADRRLGDGDRVGGVHAELGKGGGVRRLAGVVDVEGGPREHRRLGGVDRRRMHHERGVNPGEGAALQEQDLAAAALLGGRPDDADGQADVVRDPRRRDGGTERDRRDDVVPARVAHAGQRVVLGTEREMQRAAAGARDERGR